MASDGSTQILMFHRIVEDAPAAFGLPSCYRLRGTALTPSELAVALEHDRPILPLSAIEEALCAGEPPPPGYALTFDDGYREHLDVVAPLLAERGVSATFYISTGLHGDGTALAPVDAWYWLLDHASAPLGRISSPSGGVLSARVDTLAAKHAWVTGVLKRAFLESSPCGQQRMLDDLEESLRVSLPTQLAKDLYLSKPEWEGLKELGMRLGAHGVTHPRLPQLDPDELEAEIRESIAAIGRLEDEVAFAYPDGAFCSASLRILLDTGASSAVTCRPDPLDATTPCHLLPRHFVAPDTLRRHSPGLPQPPL